MSASKTRTVRARQLLLVLVLLAGSASLQSSPPAQASDSLTIRFTPSAGTFVGNERVTLSTQAKADIHYTLDGSLPTAMSPVYRRPVTLDKSTRLRAIAIAPGGPTRAGPVATDSHGLLRWRLPGCHRQYSATIRSVARIADRIIRFPLIA